MSAPNANANGTTTHRRGRSWLDGTMDIISDARQSRPRTARSPSPAPRPRRAALQTPPASPGGGGRIFSLRAASPTPGQGIIGRMPSQDAMDMSVHNDLDSSAHGGRSVGGGGGDHYYHDNGGGGGGGGGNGDLDSSIHGLRSANSTLTTKMADLEADYLNQITSLASQVKTLSEKCRLKDAQLESLESDAATAEKDLELLEMSKHTIADLKAQLYSLQDQVEDAEYAKQEALDHMDKDGAERERLLREQILTLEAEVEELEENGTGSASGGGNAATRNGAAVVPDADIRAYEDEITMLKEQLTEAKPVWGQIDSLRKEKDREISELRSMLKGRDDTIATHLGKNGALTDDLAVLEAEVDRLRAEGDAATDREEELTVLRSALAERDGQQLSAARTELVEQTELAARLTEEVAELKESHESLRTAGTGRDADMTDRIAALEEQLKQAKGTVESLTKEVEQYQRRVVTLEEERDDATASLEAARKELAESKEESSAREAASEDAELLRKEVDDVTRERMALEGELTKKLATVKKENLRAITKLEVQLNEKKEEVDFLKVRVEDSAKGESEELAAVRTQLQEAEQELEERTQEYETVKESLLSLETSLKDRDAELETASNKISALEASVEELENGTTKPVERGLSDAPDDEAGTTGSASSRIRTLEAVERELKAKLEDRDTTISALVKSSTKAESNLNELKAEVASLQEQGARSVGSASPYEEAKETMAAKHRDQILERDAAISKLVKSSVSLEQHITSLQAEVERLRKKKSGGKNADGPEWEELHRLQQESEIFAGQIIEQDEEIEGLRGELDEQRQIHASLSEQVTNLTSNGDVSNSANESRLTELQAHLDEVQESNKAQREELRDLRHKLRDAQAEAERVAMHRFPSR